jgi:pimeloyl-ACP methyl ester carboxylesterase
VVGVADPLDATLGRGGDLLQRATCQVGQVHPLRLDHSASTGFSSGAYPGSRSATSQDRWQRSQAAIARLRWAGSPSHSRVAFCPQAMRLRPLRRLPISFGWMAKRPLPDELMDRWLRSLQAQRGVRRDLRKYASSARRRQMLEVCQRLRSFDRPALVVWTPEDRVQRPEHGRRLADLLPDARLVEIPDSYTLIMRDQPEAFARAVREFVRATPDEQGRATSSY